MDGPRFDEVARRLGGTTSRRTGLLAAFGLLAALPAADALAGPGAQGPCGNGSVKQNRCRRNRECCTNICERNLKNKDKKGRCRCRNRGQACAEDRNCCVRRGQQMACIGGTCTDATCTPPDSCDVDADCCPGQVCVGEGGECVVACSPATCPNGCCSGEDCIPIADQPDSYGDCGTGGAACEQCFGECAAGVCTPGVPTGEACTPGGLVCADFQATCTTYDAGGPAGTYCLVQNGMGCSASNQCEEFCCSGSVCTTFNVCD